MTKSRWPHVVFGMGLGLLLIWFLFRGTDWRAVLNSFRHAHLGWIMLSQVLIWASFFSRIQRWTYIVRAGGQASFRHMFSATQIGFLANFTLPGRVGEVVRAVVLSRLTRLSFSKSLALVAVDRLTDFAGLIAVMFVSLCAYRPAEDIVIALGEFGEKRIPAGFIQQFALVAAASLIVLVAGLVTIYVAKETALRIADRCIGLVSEKAARFVHGMLEQFAEGLHVFRSMADMSKSLFFSFVTWGLFVLFYYSVMMAFGIECPWYAPFLVTSTVAIAVAAPIAPGFVGQFQAGIVIGVAISVPGYSYADTAAMAIAAHVITLVHVAIAGVFCLIWEDLRVREIFQTLSQDKSEARKTEGS